ncbi:MAG: U32 family peptidase [Spirochaetia bacterium]|jgi:putative protease|nr:U32 family peptidase [Spirochaetia bacterium]
MELLAPAGNIEKLYYAYKYGADAAYIGIKNFSLRAKADNFSNDEWSKVEKIKGNKKLFGALNIFFHNKDLRALEENIDYLKLYPFDTFIISDLGALPILRKYFPDIPLHLSTQANCINKESAKIYSDLGFSRIILGRETPLNEIKEIRDYLPKIEIEAFVHGAMCIAYSGRCFLSKEMSDRSANQGDCAHSCRWNYRVLEEKQRPGEYMPVIQGENFTTIMSSKDMCLIDHLDKFKEAGVDSLKIEGRMKSIYYAAVVTRAYRKMIDSLEGHTIENLEGFREELFKVSHREFSTGFYLGKEEMDEVTKTSYERKYTFLGSVGKQVGPGKFNLIVKNQIRVENELEYIGPDVLFLKDSNYSLFDKDGEKVIKADHGKVYTLETELPLKEGYILRKQT